MDNEPITHHVVVDAGVASTFDIFTTHLGAWWPLAYTFAGSRCAGAAVEPRTGGTWHERTDSGEKRSWGEVRACEPPARLVLAFAIGADRQPTPAEAASELEVRFTDAVPGRTRLDLEHRHFERHGEDAGAMRAGMNSPQGWPLILAELVRFVRRRPAVRYIVTSTESAVGFYTGRLGFTVDMRPAPGFAALSRGGLRLLLNEPGAGGAGTSLADGTPPAPGGWARVQLVVADLQSEIERLRADGCRFRGDLVEGNGGRQILVEDPSGNVVELLEPRRR